MAQDLQLPHGYRDARVLLTAVAFLGELLQGGLIFGWNAFALILKAQGNYDRGCQQSIADIGSQGLNTLCASQESKLAVLWNIGIFALNFGPVVIGPILDYVGPKLTAILGTCLNITALFLLGFSNTKHFNALHAGTVILGAGGMCFHLAQLHITNLFPRRRGLISSIFLAGFTGCAIIFYFLWLIFQKTGRTFTDFKLMMGLYAVVCFIWIPLNMWMMPWHSLRIGQVYILTDRWFFKVMSRTELEEQMNNIRMSAQDSTNLGEQTQPPNKLKAEQPKPIGNGIHVDKDVALAYMGLRPHSPRDDSSDPHWTQDSAPAQPTATTAALPGDESPPAETQANGRHHEGENGGEPAAAQIEAQEEGEEKEKSKQAEAHWEAPPPDEESGHNDNVVWGPLIFESRRFVELRQKSLWQQITSAESTGLGLFYTLNIFCIQFFLGTTRLQLEHKGDTNHHFTAFANIIPAFGFLGIPFMTWLLDKKGYGATLSTINFLTVLASLFEAMPSLRFQAVTLVVWAFGRYFLYTSYFAIFGAMFGFKNFGKLVAIDNTFNGLFGLLQLPFTNWGLHGLRGNFTWINIIQAIVLTPFFLFTWMMYRWERQDLVPIRPLVGEELPTTMVGPRTLREAKFLKSLEHKLPGTAQGGGEARERRLY